MSCDTGGYIEHFFGRPCQYKRVWWKFWVKEYKIILEQEGD